MCDVFAASDDSLNKFEAIEISSEDIQSIRQDEDLFCRNFGLNMDDVLKLVQS